MSIVTNYRAVFNIQLEYNHPDTYYKWMDSQGFCHAGKYAFSPALTIESIRYQNSDQVSHIILEAFKKLCKDYVKITPPIKPPTHLHIYVGYSCLVQSYIEQYIDGFEEHNEEKMQKFFDDSGLNPNIHRWPYQAVVNYNHYRYFGNNIYFTKNFVRSTQKHLQSVY